MNQEQTPRPGESSATSTAGGAAQPSEEEVRAALEDELKRLTVNDVLLQTLVSLLNLGGRKLGTAPGTEPERDLDQVQAAIDGVRALMPVLERLHPAELGPIRDALSQLQLAYARQRGSEGSAPAAEGEGAAAQQPAPPQEGPQQEPPEGGPGPAQRSGRLWVPGQ
jgi:hypothetical protein